MTPAWSTPAGSRSPVLEPGARTRTAATRAGALAVAALTTVTLPACSGGRDAAAAPNASATPAPSVGTALDAPLPARILDLPFTTTTGSTLRLRDLTGKLVVISDAMSLCQETCPLDTATIVNTARAEPDGANDTVFLSITVDPKRDTRAQLAAYRRLFTPTPPNWLVLTGAAATVDTLWDYLGVWRQKVTNPPGTARPRNWRTGQPLTYDVQHSDEVFFLNRHGHERFVLEGPPHTIPDTLPTTLSTFLNDQGHHNLVAPDPTNWTQAQALHVLSWLQNE